MICDTSLEYLKEEEVLACNFCGTEYATKVWCPEGHFVCPGCYNMPLTSFIKATVTQSRSRDPFDISIAMMRHPELNGKACSYALVLTGSVLTAVRNEGTVKLNDQQIFEALDLVHEQASHRPMSEAGACSMATAVGAIFGTVLGAVQAPQDEMVMKIVKLALDHLSNNPVASDCARVVLWVTMDLVLSLLAARFVVLLGGSSEKVVCYELGRTATCSPAMCRYSALLKAD